MSEWQDEVIQEAAVSMGKLLSRAPALLEIMMAKIIPVKMVTIRSLL